MRWHTVAARLAAVLASLALLGGCAAGTPSSPVATPLASPAMAVPTATPSASPFGTPSPAPSMSEGPTSNLAWHRIGSIPANADALRRGGLVGFAKGYVAVQGGSGSVWFSADGRDWREVKLPFKVTKDAFEPDVNALATNGTQVLVVGGYSNRPCRAGGPDTGGGPACPLSPIAWLSNDGVTWQSAYPGPRPSDPPGYGQGSEFVAAWPVATGGWDAALSYWRGESLHGRDLYHSGEGLRWAKLEPAPALDTGNLDKFPWVHAGAADVDGVRVLWQGWSDFADPLAPEGGMPVMTLATSPDGRAWTTIDGFTGRGTEIATGLAPTAGHTRWLLAGSSGHRVDYSTGAPTVWTSGDRATWTPTVLPIPAPHGGGRVASIALTTAGYVAAGTIFVDDGGPETWTSQSEDGLTWVELPHVAKTEGESDPTIVADGPGGTLGIGVDPASSENTASVWELR